MEMMKWFWGSLFFIWIILISCNKSIQKDRGKIVTHTFMMVDTIKDLKDTGGDFRRKYTSADYTITIPPTSFDDADSRFPPLTVEAGANYTENEGIIFSIYGYWVRPLVPGYQQAVDHKSERRV